MLQPLAYRPLPLGSVTPTGWLKTQLKIQTSGLSGHLSHHWSKLHDSVWIGGRTGDIGLLHENTPYWLNGIIPLFFLMRNIARDGKQWKTIDRGHRRTHRSLVHDLEGQVVTYVDSILDRQRDDGWIGPPPNEKDSYWSRATLMLALTQMAEADPRRRPRIVDAMTRYLRFLHASIKTRPLFNWSQARYLDILIGVYWLIDHRRPDEPAEWLVELCDNVRKQGVKWEIMPPDQGQHNVNVAMSLKVYAVLHRRWPRGDNNASSLRYARDIDEHCGQPTGLFLGDEMLPRIGTHNPSRGSELCSVVESMFSHSYSFSVFGDPAYIDVAESIAYNALPSTWASKRGGEMWSHQYFQRTNQESALPTLDPDGHVIDAHAHGVESGFACCTANFNQGWPKLAGHIFFTSGNAVAIGYIAPARARIEEVGGGGTVDLATTYPFSDEFRVSGTFKRDLDILVRVPAWATRAEILTGKTVRSLRGQNGTMVRVNVNRYFDFTVRLRPEIRLRRWYDDGAVSVHRGPIMYSFPLSPTLVVRRTSWNIAEASDFNATTAQQWKIALVVNTEFSTRDMAFERSELRPDQCAFNHSDYAPVSIAVRAVFLPDTSSYVGERAPTRSYSVPMQSSTSIRTVEATGSSADRFEGRQCTSKAIECSPPFTARLVPHGSTILRVGMMAVA